jgi:hypothetical protein
MPVELTTFVSSLLSANCDCASNTGCRLGINDPTTPTAHIASTFTTAYAEADTMDASIDGALCEQAP